MTGNREHRKPRRHQKLLLDRTLHVMRWGLSVLFFYFGIFKIKTLLIYGLDPYDAFVRTVGFPEIFRYYGVLACVLELGFAVSLWMKTPFKISTISILLFLMLGIALSVYSLIFKFSSDCGCGLLGENEYGLMVQKMILGIGIAVLYKYNDRLFIHEEKV